MKNLIVAYPLLLALDAWFVSRTAGAMRTVLMAIFVLHVCALMLSVRGLRNQRSSGALGFYVSLVLAFFVLSGRVMGGFLIVRSAVALVIVALALLAWGDGVRWNRLRPPESVRRGRGGRILRFAVASAGLYLLAFLLMADPIPRTSRALMDLGSGVRDALDPMLSWVTDAFGGDDSATESESAFESGGGGPADFGEIRALPRRAQIQQTDEPRLYIEFADRRDLDRVMNGRAYVTSKALNWFEDDVWTHSGTDGIVVEDFEDGSVDGWVTLRNAEGPVVEHRVYLLGSTGRELPALQGAIAYGFHGIIAMADGWVQGGLQGNVTYRARSAVRRLEALPAGGLRAGNLAGDFLQITNPALRVRLNELLGAANADEGGLRERFANLRRFFHENYRYSLEIRNENERAPLENFLFHERSGYCDFYATAGALLCRAMDVPSRVAFGFGGGEYYDEAGILAFRDRHAHSWTEIFLEGHGWVVYDLTPPGRNGAGPPTRGAGPSPETEAFRDAQAEPLVGSESTSWTDWLANLPKSAIYGALIILFMLMIFGSLVLRSDRDKEAARRRKRRRRDRESPLDPYPGYFLDFRKVCMAMGFGYSEGDTLRELVDRVAASGAETRSFSEMLAYHYGVRYEEAGRDKRAERDFQQSVRRFWKENS